MSEAQPSKAGNEVEMGSIIIRKLLRDDDVVINFKVSDGLPLIDALGMTAFAQQFLLETYELEV